MTVTVTISVGGIRHRYDNYLTVSEAKAVINSIMASRDEYIMCKGDYDSWTWVRREKIECISMWEVS